MDRPGGATPAGRRDYNLIMVMRTDAHETVMSAGRAASGETAALRRVARRAWLTAGLATLVLAGALYLVLHPIVLHAPAATQEVYWTLSNWQEALLKPMPASYRRTGTAPKDLMHRVDVRAARALREVGTLSFANSQIRARSAAPGFILQSSFSVEGVRVLGREWDGDLLVRAQVHQRVLRATYQRQSQTWRPLHSTVSTVEVECRLHKALGVWRIESVRPVEAGALAL